MSFTLSSTAERNSLQLSVCDKYLDNAQTLVYLRLVIMSLAGNVGAIESGAALQLLLQYGQPNATVTICMSSVTEAFSAELDSPGVTHRDILFVLAWPLAALGPAKISLVGSGLCWPVPGLSPGKIHCYQPITCASPGLISRPVHTYILVRKHFFSFQSLRKHCCSHDFHLLQCTQKFLACSACVMLTKGR